jgi:hypothetical protein
MGGNVYNRVGPDDSIALKTLSTAEDNGRKDGLVKSRKKQFFDWCDEGRLEVPYSAARVSHSGFFAFQT